jgi:hypothetical protein
MKNMHNITLVGTLHVEKGNCNLNEFYKIIESINPEVIFEELSPSYYNECYIEKKGDKLETNTIIKYLENHQELKHIPVDCAEIPEPSFFELNRSMHLKLEKRSHGYCRIVDINSDYSAAYGFIYLNSNDYIKMNDIYENEIIETIKFIGDESLMSINQQWLDFMSNREDVMISKIYDYCKENNFEKGLFYIGATHRSAIIEKTQKYNETSEIKITWNYLNYGDILQWP